MAKKIISMSVDEKVYSEYLKLCKGHGIVMSKQIENFMQDFIRRMKK